MFSTPKCQTLYICNKCHQSVQNLTERRTRSSAVAVMVDGLKYSLLRDFCFQGYSLRSQRLDMWIKMLVQALL